MKNYWLDANPVVVDMDYILSEVWSRKGTFGEFLQALNPEQREILFNMTLTDGAMDQKQRGEGCLLQLGRVQSGWDEE
jgi:hypothetical protein